jgi:hypothetical protein
MNINLFRGLNGLIPLLGIPFLFSCSGGEKFESPSVVFTQPQPAEEKNIPAFPERIMGKYRGVNGENYLQITDKLIINTSVFEFKIKVSELDSNLRLSGDTVINPKTGEKTKVVVKNDSLFQTNSYTDTVFTLNYDNVLRKFRGHYFLNKRFEGESWEVKQLSLDDGQLIIGSIRSPEDIENLSSISESSDDTLLPRKFNLSRKQFRQYLGKDGFRDRSIYLRETNPR